jgi:hypothetical protein
MCAVSEDVEGRHEVKRTTVIGWLALRRMHGEQKRKGKERRRILTETEKDEEKEGGSEHGPKLDAGVEEDE